MSVGVTEDKSEKIVLTPREIAIAQGEDPDEVAAVKVEPEKTDPETDQAGPGQEADAKSGDGGGKEAAEGWIDDGIREMATSYGWSDADLASMGSPEVVRQVGRFFDQQLVKAGKVEPEKTEAKEESQPETKPVESKVETKQPDLDLQKYRDAGWDEETLKLVETVKAQQEFLAAERSERERLAKELASVSSAVQISTRAMEERQIIERSNRFHDVVDGMDEGWYGRTVDAKGDPVDPGDTQQARRRKLGEAMETLEAGLIARARREGQKPQIPPLPVLIRRAEQLAFGDELRDKERIALQEKVAAQSRRRRPVGQSRQSPVAAPVKGDEDPVAAVANHPEMIKLWKRFEQENGSGP